MAQGRRGAIGDDFDFRASRPTSRPPPYGRSVHATRAILHNRALIEVMRACHSESPHESRLKPATLSPPDPPSFSPPNCSENASMPPAEGGILSHSAGGCLAGAWAAETPPSRRWRTLHPREAQTLSFPPISTPQVGVREGFRPLPSLTPGRLSF